jgi:hypothetical protein
VDRQKAFPTRRIKQHSCRKVSGGVVRRFGRSGWVSRWDQSQSVAPQRDSMFAANVALECIKMLEVFCE